MLVRTVIAAAMVVLVRRSGTSALPGPVGLLGGVALLVTFVVSGHAITGEYVPAALVADLVHLGAAGLWVGGLVSLLVLGGARDPAAVRRFSAVASWAVAALIGSAPGHSAGGPAEEARVTPRAEGA